MDTNSIKILLKKFYLGETSREEEQLLANFFLRDDTPEEFDADKKIFHALNNHSVEVPRESEQAIESLIDSFTEEKKVNRRVNMLHVRNWAIGVAASFALIIGVSLFQKNQYTKQPLFTDTYKNPDDAYKATMDALQLFSENFSKGAETAQKANARLEEAQKIINQSIK